MSGPIIKKIVDEICNRILEREKKLKEEEEVVEEDQEDEEEVCLLYTSPSPRDRTRSRMPSSA